MITVRIDGPDVSDHVRTDVSRRTVKMSLALGSQWTATLPVFDVDPIGGYRADTEQILAIDEPSFGTIFYGQIASIQEGALDPESDQGVLQLLTARAAMSIMEQIEDVTVVYPAGMTRKAIVTDLIATYLAPFGITIDPTMTTGDIMPEMSFDGAKPQDVLNQIQTITGEVWRLTPGQVLEVFEIGDKVASFSLDGTNAGSVTVNKTSNKYLNRAVLKAGPTAQLVKDDVVTADGIADSWVMRYTPLPDGAGFIVSRGVVHEDDGVTPRDATLSAPGDGGEYEFDPVTNTLTRTSGVPAAGVIITFTPTVQFPITVTAQDGPSIVLHGLWSKKFADANVTDIDTAEEVAAGLLATGLAMPRECSLMTTEGLALPGTVIALDFPKRLITGDWVVVKVDVADFEADLVEYAYTLQSGPRAQGNYTDALRGKLSGGTSGVVSVTGAVGGGGGAGIGSPGLVAVWLTPTTLTTTADVPFLSTPNVFAAGQEIRGSEAFLYLYETDQGADLKRWRLNVSGGGFYVQTLDDAATTVLKTPFGLSRDGAHATFSSQVEASATTTTARTLIAQAGPFGVSHYFTATPVAGAHVNLASEIVGSASGGSPLFKIAGYYAGDSGANGDAIYGLNVIARWNSGHPDSNIIGSEIDIANNDSDCVIDQTPWVDGLLIVSGGTNKPHAAIHIYCSAPTNPWVKGIEISNRPYETSFECVTHIGVEVGGPSSASLIGAFVGRQLNNGDDTLLLQRRTNTTPTGFLIRGVDASANTLFAFGITGSLTMPVANASIEIGDSASANTPFFDFQSSGNANDYDSRLIASGGGAGSGLGDLTLTAATFLFGGHLDMYSMASSIAGAYKVAIRNASATGRGAYIAGGTGTNPAFVVADYLTTTNLFQVRGDGLITLPTYTAATFAAGDKYLVVDASGNVHRSALGPAS